MIHPMMRTTANPMIRGMAEKKVLSAPVSEAFRASPVSRTGTATAVPCIIPPPRNWCDLNPADRMEAQQSSVGDQGHEPLLGLPTKRASDHQFERAGIEGGEETLELTGLAVLVEGAEDRGVRVENVAGNGRD